MDTTVTVTDTVTDTVSGTVLYDDDFLNYLKEKGINSKEEYEKLPEAEQEQVSENYVMRR